MLPVSLGSWFCWHMLLTHYRRGILSCSPSHPSVGVDVERGNGPCEQRCCLIQPDLHVGTGIPQRLSTLVLPIVPQTNKDADTFLWKKIHKKDERKTLPRPLLPPFFFLERQSWGRSLTVLSGKHHCRRNKWIKNCLLFILLAFGNLKQAKLTCTDPL